MVRELEIVELPLRFRGDAGAMLEAARELPAPFLFDSGAGGMFGRTSMLAVGCVPFVSWHAGDASLDDPLAPLREHLAAYRVRSHERWPFAGGVVGWLSYDARVAFEDLPARHPTATPLPDIYLAATRIMAVRNELTGEAAVLALVDPRNREEGARVRAAAEAVRERLEIEGERQPGSPAGAERLSVRAPSRALHLERIERALAHIARGDVYQVNLAHRFETDRPRDLISFYRRLRTANPPAFGAFVEVDGEALLCVSPERFLKVESGRAVTRPIKGTAPRSPDPGEDAALARALMGSQKDRAELAMIVDILRNDLNRVCAPGSVRVVSPLLVETHPTVHHLVAEIEGHLEAGRDAADLLRATFPGGSITGAPRIRAMELIDDLEACRRGPYCGSLGWFGYDGQVDLNILIRTAYTGGQSLYFHGGGGIVADSDPASEHEETIQKVRGILRTCIGT